MLLVIITIIIAAISCSWWLGRELQLGRRLAMVGFIFSGLMMITVAGMRTNYGYDLGNYHQIYNEVASWQQALSYPLEKGYILLGFLFKQLDGGFPLFMMVIAIASVGLKLRAIYQLSSWPLVSLLLYLLIYLVINDMEQIRTGLAIGLFMTAGLSLLAERKKIALAWLLMALSFHTSAILGFAVLLWDKIKKINWQKSLALIGLSTLIGSIDFFQIVKFINEAFLNSTYLSQKLKAYETTSFSIVLTVIFRLVVYFGFLLIAYQAQKKQHRFLLATSLMSICSLLLFRNIHMLGVRGSSYFKVFEVIIIPEIALVIIRDWSKATTIKRATYLGLMLLIIIYVVYNFYRLMIAPEYFNYRLID